MATDYNDIYNDGIHQPIIILQILSNCPDVQMLILQKPLPFDVWALSAGCRRRQSFDACITNMYIGIADLRLCQSALVLNLFLTHQNTFQICKTSVCDKTKLKIGFEQISHL